jgi:cytochrome oxidase Cu insertion factor (SCO1/SenC/PrrC family)
MYIWRVQFPRRSVLAVAGLVAAAGLVAGITFGDGAGGGVPGPPSPSIGAEMDRALPNDIATAKLTDEEGESVELQQFRGRAVLLVPFLTSCQEECPVTTGALLELERYLRTDGIARKAVIVEVTVDPGRDDPARLAAYARLTGSDWPLLTASSAMLSRLWAFFGVYYQRVAEGTPPGIDWETGRPYTYDVDHSDGFILLDEKLHERFFAGGMVKIADIPAQVRTLLDAQGVENLRDPGGGSWTVPDALEAIGWVLGSPIAHVP